MSDTSVIAILASVGILLAGTVTADAAALAAAIQQGDPVALEQFVRQHPESQWAPDALLLVADITNDRPTDSARSSVNPDLACSLTITRSTEGKATVTWQMSGAASAVLTPLGFKKGAPIPLTGSKEIDYDGKYLRAVLIVKDIDGNEVKCSVVLNSQNVDVRDNLGFGNSPPAYVPKPV